MAIAFRRLLSLPSFPSFPSLHSLIHPAGVERGRKESGGRGIRVRRPTIYHRLSGSDRQADRPNLGRRGQNLGSERASKERGFLGFGCRYVAEIVAQITTLLQLLQNTFIGYS